MAATVPRTAYDNDHPEGEQMTDMMEPTDATEELADGTPESLAPDNSDAVAKARREAASYRTKLRETEQARDAAHGTVTALRRQVAEHMAAAEGIKPDALWAAGYTPDDLANDQGGIDAEKVADAVSHTRERLGISRFSGVADQGAHGRLTPKADESPTWGNLLNK